LNGTDYPTPDGTCQRDYIHIDDLAQAHVQALKYLSGGGESVILNVGYGVARSVREVIEAMKRVSGREIKVTTGPRRAGDASLVMADTTKIRNVLGWVPRFNDLELICRSAFQWEEKLQALQKSGEWK
jgi:UDP-glucose 4-epimerase